MRFSTFSKQWNKQAANGFEEKLLIEAHTKLERRHSDKICFIVFVNVIFYCWICISIGTFCIFPLHDILYYDYSFINIVIFITEVILFLGTIIIGITIQTPHWNLRKYSATILCTTFIYLLGLPYNLPVWIGILTPRYSTFDSNVYRYITQNRYHFQNEHKMNYPKELKVISLHHYLSKSCRESYAANEWIFYTQINKYLNSKLNNIYNKSVIDLTDIYNHIRYIHIRAYIINVCVIIVNVVIHWISFIRLLSNQVGDYYNSWTFFLFVTKSILDFIIILFGIFYFLYDLKLIAVFNRKSFCNDLHCLSQYNWYLDDILHGKYASRNRRGNIVKERKWIAFYENWKQIYFENIVGKMLFDRFGNVFVIIHQYLFDESKLKHCKQEMLFCKDTRQKNV
eukprot:378159_1